MCAHRCKDHNHGNETKANAIAFGLFIGFIIGLAYIQYRYNGLRFQLKTQSCPTGSEASCRNTQPQSPGTPEVNQ
jgi:hypothetical protein